MHNKYTILLGLAPSGLHPKYLVWLNGNALSITSKVILQQRLQEVNIF